RAGGRGPEVCAGRPPLVAPRGMGGGLGSWEASRKPAQYGSTMTPKVVTQVTHPTVDPQTPATPNPPAPEPTAPEPTAKGPYLSAVRDAWRNACLLREPRSPALDLALRAFARDGRARGASVGSLL